jgi:uncharacterized protein YwgA
MNPSGISKMNRNAIVQAALASAGPNILFGPAQLQKLMFLVDKEIPNLIGGPIFAFEPYDYGPFDKAVYYAMDELCTSGAAEISSAGRYRKYSLTENGFTEGSSFLTNLPKEARDFLKEAATWVTTSSFHQMVSAIYRKYPDMKANSIFKEAQG